MVLRRPAGYASHSWKICLCIGLIYLQCCILIYMSTFNLSVSLTATMPMLKPYQRASTGIYFFVIPQFSSGYAHIQSNLIAGSKQLYHVHSLDYTACASRKIWLRQLIRLCFPCAMKDAQYLTLLKFSSWNLSISPSSARDL